MFSKLTLKGISEWVFLGCSDEERAIKQEIQIHLELNYHEIPRGCHSDLLEDTICYEKLRKIINEVCCSKKFRLIEHLGHKCYLDLKSVLPKNCDILIQIHKLKPPVQGLTKGAVFSIGDFCA